jgi:hypothetical protein
MADTPEMRGEGYYSLVLGQNPPEVAYWERGEWWLCGNEKPWQPARCVTQPGTARTVKEMGPPVATRRAFSQVGKHSLTCRDRLRSVTLIRSSFVHNLAYYRAGHETPRKALLDGSHSHAVFWRQPNLNCLDLRVLEWCKLIGHTRGDAMPTSVVRRTSQPARRRWSKEAP